LISAGGVNSLKGTIFWMAPEVIRQTGYGRQADIWSLGCTVIEMATGKPPWSGEFSEQISALFNIATTTDPPPLPDYLSEDAKHFLTLCFLRSVFSVSAVA
jgi:serine/threonine protein kinase